MFNNADGVPYKISKCSNRVLNIKTGICPFLICQLQGQSPPMITGSHRATKSSTTARNRQPMTESRGSPRARGGKPPGTGTRGSSRGSKKEEGPRPQRGRKLSAQGRDSGQDNGGWLHHDTAESRVTVPYRMANSLNLYVHVATMQCITHCRHCTPHSYYHGNSFSTETTTASEHTE